MSFTITADIAPECAGTEAALWLQDHFVIAPPTDGISLSLRPEGLCLVSEEQVLRGDLCRLLPRIKGGRISSEFLVRAAKIKGAERPTAFDATAGLGEDSFLLAAAGFSVTLYERNPIIFALLLDAVRRAKNDPELSPIVSRMDVKNGDSVEAMAQLEERPDVILLDPMFPERQKSALVKKKLQMLQKLETPCSDERELLLTAMGCGPRKLIVKRPPKGPFLAGVRPDHSVTGKAVRYDCFVSPLDRIEKYRKEAEKEII